MRLDLFQVKKNPLWPRCAEVPGYWHMCGETNGEWFGLWATAEEGRTELNVLVKEKADRIEWSVRRPAGPPV